MQKPRSKPVKDFIMEQIAKDLQFPLETVETVIGWSYKQASIATQTNKEIELSGIGKAMLSQAKLKKFIARLERMLPGVKVPEYENDIKEHLVTLKSWIK